ncbi:hypothetical protein C8R45DRAFT_1000526 [Mycena sanguinolenta]|nr:hypothetical protein C8R45DRAFT_1000526 [Mycena sanguinolenta]
MSFNCHSLRCSIPVMVLVVYWLCEHPTGSKGAEALSSSPAHDMAFCSSRLIKPNTIKPALIKSASSSVSTPSGLD